MRLLLLLTSLIFLSSSSCAYMNINIYGTGMFLPYSIGIIGYIKKHFPLPEANITGISGGAICSILYTQEDELTNPDKIWDYMIGGDINELALYKDMRIFQKNIGDNLKLRYRDTPRDFKNISVISTPSYYYKQLYLSPKNQTKQYCLIEQH